jgi:hypothetical protein
MRRCLLLLLALLALSCRRPQGVNAPVDVLALVVSTSSDDAEIALREPDEEPRVGDVRTDTELTFAEQLGTFTAESGHQAKLLMEERDSRVVRTEVLEVAGGGVVRWRITFEELDVVRKANATPTKGKLMPQLRKPYVIDAGAQPIAVTDDQGRPLPEAERAAVLREVTIGYKLRQLREPGAVAAGPAQEPAAPVHRARPGDPMPWLAAHLERRFSYDTSESHTEAKVLQADLKEIRDVDGEPHAVATIWIQLLTTGTDERRIGTEVRGEALVRAKDGEVVALMVKGADPGPPPGRARRRQSRCGRRAGQAALAGAARLVGARRSLTLRSQTDEPDGPKRGGASASPRVRSRGDGPEPQQEAGASWRPWQTS